MADDLILQLRALKNKLESSKEAWMAYMGSYATVDDEFIASTQELITTSSIASRIKAIHARRTFLQPRLQILSGLPYPILSHYSLDSTTELIERHIPSETYGLETTNTLIHRGLTEVEMFLAQMYRLAINTERHVYLRLDRIQDLAEASVYVLISKLISTSFAARVTNLVRSNKASDPSFDRLEEVLLQVASGAESQVLFLLKCSHDLGVKMARQRLLTEFFHLSEAVDGLVQVEALLHQYVEKFELALTICQKLSGRQEVPAGQRVITDFFDKVEGMGQSGNVTSQ